VLKALRQKVGQVTFHYQPLQKFIYLCKERQANHSSFFSALKALALYVFQSFHFPFGLPISSVKDILFCFESLDTEIRNLFSKNSTNIKHIHQQILVSSYFEPLLQHYSLLYYYQLINI